MKRVIVIGCGGSGKSTLSRVLSEKTIERKSKELLAFTTILKYKGLEDNNIILVIPASEIKSSWDNFLFEIYVGMTRAIMNLDIIILKSN